MSDNANSRVNEEKRVVPKKCNCESVSVSKHMKVCSVLDITTYTSLFNVESLSSSWALMEIRGFLGSGVPNSQSHVAPKTV